MAMKSVKVEITSTSPLLMHAFPLQPITALDKKTPEEQAEYAAYRCPETGELFIPGVAIQRALVSAATFSKGKGRASLQKQVAACVLVAPERVLLGMKTYAIDSRPVVVPATKGRVMRHRPRLDNWVALFSIDYDPDLITENQLRQIVDDMCSRVGLLDFRPEKKGPFGRSMVTAWS